jgi:hypothetical protein
MILLSPTRRLCATPAIAFALVLPVKVKANDPAVPFDLGPILERVVIVEQMVQS